MSQEKRPDMNDWRERLAKLDRLPDEPVADSVVNWNKIQSRLNVQKRAIPYFWYSGAAAILVLLIASIPFMDFDNRKKAVSNETTIHTVVPPTNIATLHMSSATASDSTSAIRIKASPKRNIKRTATTSRKDIAPIAPTAKSTLPDTITQDNALQSAPINSRSQVATIAAVPKKKLKVLHINEIQYEEKLTAAADRQPDIRVNERSGEGLSRAYVHNKAADQIIKIKLPSN